MRKLAVFVKYACLILWCITTVYPFIWMFFSSLKDSNAIMANSFAPPSAKTIQLGNFVKAWNIGNIGNNFVNSVFISVLAVVITLLTGAMAAYVLSRVKPSVTLYAFFALGIMIPIQTILIPVFEILKYIHMTDTRVGLAIEYVASYLPYAIVIMTAFMGSIPSALEEAASMDGCTRVRSFISIILPISIPTLSTVGILTFLHCWNDYVLAYVIISSPNLQTITEGIYLLSGSMSGDYGALFAGLLIAIIPVVIVYLLFSEMIVKGMTAGAVKG